MNKNHIGSEDLSIVLQGPSKLGKLDTALRAAKSARKWFPESEIVLSCWANDEIGAVSKYVDAVVTSVDPGPQLLNDGVLNVNRQIVSSAAGSERASRPFVLKARTDLIFSSKNIWGEYLKQRGVFRGIDARDPIMITNLTTINPNRHNRYFALCDWIYLGPKKLVTELFSVPYFPEEYLDFKVDGHSRVRYNAEQWIALNFFKSRGLDLKNFPNGYVDGKEVSRLHMELIGQYFTLSSWYRLGLKTQKHRITSFSLDNMYTQKEWLRSFCGTGDGVDLERLVIAGLYNSRLRRFIRRALTRA